MRLLWPQHKVALVPLLHVLALLIHPPRLRTILLNLRAARHSGAGPSRSREPAHPLLELPHPRRRAAPQPDLSTPAAFHSPQSQSPQLKGFCSPRGHRWQNVPRLRLQRLGAPRSPRGDRNAFINILVYMCHCILYSRRMMQHRRSAGNSIGPRWSHARVPLASALPVLVPPHPHSGWVRIQCTAGPEPVHTQFNIDCGVRNKYSVSQRGGPSRPRSGLHFSVRSIHSTRIQPSLLDPHPR